MVTKANSDFPYTNCSLIEQQCKFYRGKAVNDADSVEKFRICKTHEINRRKTIAEL